MSARVPDTDAVLVSFWQFFMFQLTLGLLL